MFKKRKAQRRGLILWTIAGAVFYIALYWAIIGEIIIRKGHVLQGIVFLLAVTAISIGGLLLLYSLTSKQRGNRLEDDSQASNASPEELPQGRNEVIMPVTERTTELLEKDDSNKQERTNRDG